MFFKYFVKAWVAIYLVSNKPKQSEPEVSKENLEYEALPTKNEDEEAGQDAETEE